MIDFTGTIREIRDPISENLIHRLRRSIGFNPRSVELRHVLLLRRGQLLHEAVFDAALDVMGFHMIITDADRRSYLGNMFRSLRPGAPAFFIHESYREEAYSGPVASFADWERISGSDYSIPQERQIGDTGKTVLIPL